ncbi:uncharacterized protein K02A2.6-like [Belonocnema kinseyi]|uniref:uncharacterized protein K02A2.6-like n=1 Tax=Belonocnema kinseyi TaxID=2817044 RepID=UPI00143DC0C3|nr:uncharacterized protein K02A2.6-like [Belonocnema kinseyi]
MYVDYRLLNKKRKLDLHPLTNIDDQIDRLSGKKFFTSLDLKSGFYQIPIDEDSIKITGFVTPDNHYEFLRIPFGLKNSPAVFQRAINRAFGELRFSIALVYTDDILVTASSIEEAFQNLESVLQALKKNNFSLNLAKCKFLQTTIDYLGRKISEKKFIKDFASIVAPLTDLLRKEASRKYESEQANVVRDLKRILTDRPILALFDPTLETELHTDASLVGLGAMLMQKKNGEKRVVSYYSLTDCSAIRATAVKRDIHHRLLIDVTDNEWIKVTQMQDPDLEIIHKILETEDVQANTKQYFDLYDLRGGVVFRRTETGNKWVVPRASRFNIVKMHHDDQGHFAFEETIEKIKEHYWFKGMKKFVVKYVHSCLNCLYYKSTSGCKPGLLHPIEKIAIPFHTLHLDHVGPFVKNKRKNTHILAIIDGFTKYCIVEPVKDTKTKWVIKILQQVFGLFGVPTKIISDRGTCFTSKHFTTFCQEYGIKNILNAVATPRANGQVERLNFTILNSLATTSAGASKYQWDDYVKKVQSGINCTINRTTRKSLAQLLYSFKPRSSADAALQGAIQDALDQINLKELRREARRVTDEEQARKKFRFYSKRFKPARYTVGDIVLVTSRPAAKGQIKKLTAKSKGPFKVTAVLPDDRYEVVDLRELKKARGQRTVRIHISGCYGSPCIS